MENKIILNYERESDRKFLTGLLHQDPLNNLKLKTYLYIGKDLFLTCEPAHALINLLIFRIVDYYDLGKDHSVRKEYIFKSNYDKGKPMDYSKHVLDVVLKDWDNEKNPDRTILIPWFLSELKHVFSQLSVIVDGNTGLTFDLVDTFRAYNDNKKFKNVIDKPYCDHYDDIYTAYDKHTKMVSSILKDTPINPIYDLYRAGTKINNAQVGMWFSWGLIPNYRNPLLDDVAINCTSGILNGFKKKEELAEMFGIQRKALFALKSDIKDTGVLSKTISIGLTEIALNKPDTREMVDDCGSESFATAYISSEKDLRRYRWKYFLNDNGEYEYVDVNRTDLIGKTIKYRAIHLCKAEGCVCKRCTGANYEWLSDNSLFKNNLGMFVATELAEDMQGVISLKHHVAAILVAYTRATMSYKGYTGSFKNIVNKFPEIIFEFDKFKFKDKNKCSFEIINSKWTNGKLLTYVKVFYNGEEVSSSAPIVLIDGENKVFRVIVYNTSVIGNAQRLSDTLSSHDKDGPYKFIYDPVGKTITELMNEFCYYLDGNLGLPHILYAEAFARILIRDKDNTLERPSKTTKALAFAKIENLTKNNNYNWNKILSGKMLNGYIGKTLHSVMISDKVPSQYDILYNSLEERDSLKINLSKELNGNIIPKVIHKNLK